MIRLPKKITPDPIVQAVIEIRFEPKVQADAVFHFVSESETVKTCFGNLSTLPVYELPAMVRKNEPGLKYSPYFQLEGLKEYIGYTLQVGPRVLSLVTNGSYKGSKDFLPKTSKLFSSVYNHGAIGKVERLGVRYIDFFEVNIFDHVKLKIDFPEQSVEHKNSSIRLEFPVKDGFIRTLHLASNMMVNLVKEQNGKKGSILDIDSYTESLPTSFLSDPEPLLLKGHFAQKELFYSLINEEFLRSLKPEYED